MDQYRMQIFKQALARLNQACSESGSSTFEPDTTDTSSRCVTTNGERVPVFVQSWAPQQDFDTLVRRVREKSGNVLLLADFINPVMAEKLKRRGIYFVDCSGNMHVRISGLIVYRKGNRDIRVSNRRQKGRMFNPVGLQLLYAFFNAPELVNASYRNIARHVGVALGSIGPVFDDLQLSGYMVELDGEKKLTNKKRLFERWVESYLEKLRPKQLIGCYSSNDAGWWKKVDASSWNMLWGGEVVIARQTPFLLPEQTTLYSVDGGVEAFTQAAMLQPDPEGDVCIYHAFWRNNQETDSVSPMIVYADLVDSIDPGNWDVAKTFYGDAVKHLLDD